jgi:uncharacterized protein involved in outer membrane biogenesis
MKGRPKKILIGLIIFFAVFTLFGFFGLPPIVKSVLTKKLSEALHREVTIQQIKMNPYALSLTVRGFLVKDRGSAETFVSFEEFYVNLQSLSAIKMAVVLKEIRLKQPYVKINRTDETTYNFSDLIEKKEPRTAETPAGKPAEKPKPLRFSLNNIIIDNGSIDFWDGPKQTKHTVKDLNIGVPFLSNIPAQIETFVQPAFSAKINETPYMLQGKTKPFADTLETNLDINIKDLDIPHYLAYFPSKLNFKIVSAYLDTQAQLSFIQYKDKGPSMTVTGNVSLKKVALDDEKKNPLFRLPLLEIAIASAEPLKKAVHLSKISIQSPELEVRRNPAGALNIESLLPQNKAAQSSPQPEKKEGQASLSIDVDEVRLTGGRVSFSDLSRKKPFKTILYPIEMKVDHFSNGKDKKTAYALSIISEARENVNLGGELSVEPLWAGGELEIKSVPLKKYSPYYQDQVLFNLEEGRLNFSTRYKYAKGEREAEISLSELSVILNSLRLKRPDEKEDFLKIPVLSVKDTLVDVTRRRLTVGSFSTEKGMLTLTRFKDGKLSLQSLFPEPAKKEENQKKEEEKQTQEKVKQIEKPWLVKVGKVSVDGYTIKTEDQTPAEPVTLMLDEFRLKADNLSTAEGQKGKAALSLRFNQKGTISMEGGIGITPVSADLKMNLNNIEVRPLQPYFTDKVKITVTEGALSTTGTLALGYSDRKELKATYVGEASLNNFSTIDKQNAEDVFKMESLAFNDLRFDSNPFALDIKGIALSNFYARLLMNPDGTLNLQQILGGEGTKKEAPAPKDSPSPPPEKKAEEPPRNIKIGSVTLQGGRIDFSDQSVKPEFSLKLTEMGGRVSGLSSEETALADVELRTKLNDYAPLEITGKVNPLKKDLYVDLKVRFKDMDLSPATPYSGKYVGYAIEKGKLSFDLSYLIDKRKLDSKNVIFLDQFNLGDRVESPNATKLPVKLAIALLKDRSGQIKLDIPVSGSLDDPKFSIWGIIVKILVNLMAKAATSPFALLGAVFGGGEELSYIEFEYGMTAVTEPSQKKIDTLIKALSERPALKLDIEGHADLERDREGLKQLFFQRKLKAERLKEIVKQGQPAVAIDEVKIDPQEYPKYLKLAYKEEKFPKPRNILGMAKDIPAPDMEKLMFTHIEVKESDLRALANQRAMSVKNAISKSGKIEPERVFIIEPKSLSPEKKEKLKDSRVELKLK